MTNHPILPCGYNSWEINGDEMNSPGVNEPIWPMLFDSFVPLEVLLVTPPMLDVFDKECPDLVIPHEEWVQLFPLAEFPLELKGPWPEIVIPGEAVALVIKGTDDTLVIQGRSPTWAVSPQSKGLLVTDHVDTTRVS